MLTETPRATKADSLKDILELREKLDVTAGKRKFIVVLPLGIVRDSGTAVLTHYDPASRRAFVAVYSGSVIYRDSITHEEIAVDSGQCLKASRAGPEPAVTIADLESAPARRGLRETGARAIGLSLGGGGRPAALPIALPPSTLRRRVTVAVPFP
jgi:hypothetical protein